MLNSVPLNLTPLAAGSVGESPVIPAPSRFISYGGFDNNHYTLINIADPVNDQDAATKKFVATTISSSLAYINTGSFSGSFYGDGSNLEGVASTLTVSSSITTHVIDLKTEPLIFVGENGLIATLTDNVVQYELPQGSVSSSTQINTGSFTGSFTGQLLGTSSWAVNSLSSTFIQSFPPSGSIQGSLWWDNESGKLYVYYNDGNSTQWVQATPDILAEGPVGTFSLNGNLVVQGNTTVEGTLFETSDQRLKTNVTEITSAVEMVNDIRGVEFDWIHSGKHSFGVIAQEIEQHFPFLIGELPDGIKTVNYSAIIGVLIQAVKELSAEVEVLKKDRT